MSKRICLWSGPRNISTALMYSFAQREDTKVYDEPLYGFYLKNSKARSYHPGAEEIVNTMECDGEEVIKMMMGSHEKQVVFFKQMTHHLLDLTRDFMENCQHIILTRDPIDMLPSYAKQVEQPTMKDVGYRAHLSLIKYLESNGITYVVIDSKKVLLNPEKQLDLLCKNLSIPFLKSMLAWEKGPRKEDGIWAKYWYENVHNSTGFKKYKAKTSPFPNHLTALLKEAQPIYEQLIKKAI